jgi:hypothetical protein
MCNTDAIFETQMPAQEHFHGYENQLHQTKELDSSSQTE